MKKTLFLIILTTLALSCSGTTSDNSLTSTESSDVSLTSAYGTVNGLQIKDVPFGTDIIDFRSGITVATTSQFEIYQSDGVTPATELITSTRIKVTAEDNSTETYLVEVLPDPRIIVSLTTFDPDSTDYQIVGASFVNGFGDNTSAISFNGSSVDTDYMLIPYDENDPKYNLTTKGTIEVLVKANSFKTCAGIVSKGQEKDFSDEAYGIQLYPYAGSNARLLFFLYEENGQWIGVHGSFNLEADTWYHIIATWDEGKMYLYVNGVLDVSADNTTGGVRTTTGGITVGAQLTSKYNNTYGNFEWDGIIDRVSIFNEVITQEEVTARFNALSN